MSIVLLALGIGVLVGIVVGVLGAGGGILSVPILVYVLGFEPHAAAAASLVIVGASSLTSLLPHARQGNVQWAQGAAFGGLGAVGALVGAQLTRLVGAELLMVLLAVLLLAVAIVMLRKSWLAARRERRHPVTADVPPVEAGQQPDDEQPAAKGRRVLLTITAASVSGLLTGFFGVGGGFIVVPALLLIMGVGMRAAVGTSLLVIVINTIIGLAGRIGTSYEVDWAVVIAFAAASMVGGLIGARLSTRTKPAILSLLFGLLLAAVALSTAVQAVPALLSS